MKVLLFGGSFDPIHYGHLKLVDYAYQQLSVDKCLFVLAKNPRWKTPNCNELDRLNMLKLALEEFPNFEICLNEFNSSKEVNYTFDTISELDKNNQYYYLIGLDQLEQLDKWYKIDELSSLVQFVVFKRIGYRIHQENLNKYHCILLDNELIDVSSTKIRNLESVYTTRKVLEYIAKNKLYYFNKIKNYIKDKRLEHSCSVAFLSLDMAKSNHIDENKAYIAGLIHDIGKEIDQITTENIMNEYFYEEKEKVGKWAYHQFVGVKIAREVFLINDEEILDAICYHATGKDKMTTLGKIIYVADKLDPLRGWDSSYLINECKKDITKAFPIVLVDNIKYFKNHNTKYQNELTLKCFAYYLDSKEYENG